jgi:Uncharacterized protein conserved in bacteria
MNIIQVEPSILETTANKMELKNNNYQATYQQLIQAVDQTSAFWTGKDQIAYVNEIMEFENKLLKLNILLNEYSDFLKKSARAYRLTQDSIMHLTKKLSTY